MARRIVTRRADAVAQNSDPLGLELDDVSRPEPRVVAANPAGAQHVARHELRVPRGVVDDWLPGDVVELALRAPLAVHAGDQLEPEAAELVSRDDYGAETRREVSVL